MSRDSRLRLPSGMGPRLDRRRIVLPFAPLLKDPKPRAAQLSELVFGQDFDVHAERGRYVFGRVVSLVPGARRKGYLGWVPRSALSGVEGRVNARVAALSAPVFCRADIKSHIVMSLPMNARLRIVGEDGHFVQIGAGAYLHRAHVRSRREFDADFVEVAQRFLGQPYIWGGTGARGVDCSGFVQMALAACGIDAPRDADMQEGALGEVVDHPAQRGDLLFWPGHVGLLSGPDTLLHANAFHMSVVEEPLGAALRRMEAGRTVLRTVRRLAIPSP